MADDLEAGGGSEPDGRMGVYRVSTMERTFQADLEADQVNEVEREIRNLLSFTDEVVSHKTLCKVALEVWQKNANFLVNRLDKLKKESRNNTNQIYQLAGFFSAFQGLLFTAVAQSILLHKNNRAFPLALSAFATVLTVLGVLQKNMQTGDLRKTIKDENPSIRVFLARVQKLKQQGIKFSFQKCADEEDQLLRARRSKLAAAHKGACPTFLGLLISYEAGVVVAIILFGGLCLVAMNQILSNPM